MFVILVYDVEEKRVAKALKKCRKYLNWVQNSVFEGELTTATLFKLKSELLDIIDVKKDSVVLYEFRSMNYSERNVIGIDKRNDSMFL